MQCIAMPKKTVSDKFIIELNAIDTKILSPSGLVTATQYDSDKQGLEKKIADVEKKTWNIDGFVKKMDYNIVISETESKTPDTTDLTKAPEFNWLTKIRFDGRITKVTKSLVSKSQVDITLDIADKNREKKDSNVLF